MTTNSKCILFNEKARLRWRHVYLYYFIILYFNYIIYNLIRYNCRVEAGCVPLASTCKTPRRRVMAPLASAFSSSCRWQSQNARSLTPPAQYFYSRVVDRRLKGLHPPRREDV